jgi:hypothetical protein
MASRLQFCALKAVVLPKENFEPITFIGAIAAIVKSANWISNGPNLCRSYLSNVGAFVASIKLGIAKFHC